MESFAQKHPKTESDRLAGKFKLWEWDPLEFNGNNATKEELLRVQSPYILHLATHGFFAPAEPAGSSQGNNLYNSSRRSPNPNFSKIRCIEAG